MNNILVDHLKICGLFSDFLYAFCSVWSYLDLLVVVSDRIELQRLLVSFQEREKSKRVGLWESQLVIVVKTLNMLVKLFEVE